jgi:hypothetical protein
MDCYGYWINGGCIRCDLIGRRLHTDSSSCGPRSKFSWRRMRTQSIGALRLFDTKLKKPHSRSSIHSYGSYASSAVAGQSTFRNLVATVFPLFTTQYFAALGYQWGNTIFALIALAMMPIPAVRTSLPGCVHCH